MYEARVITIIGLSSSEASARRCKKSAMPFGVDVRTFQAVTRFDAMEVMRSNGLSIDRTIYNSIVDGPVPERTVDTMGNWQLTAPELGCFMSHYMLWQEAIKCDEPLIVLEDDVVLLGTPPEIPGFLYAASLAPGKYQGTQGYIITPRGAAWLIDRATLAGIQPVDEFMWRGAMPRHRFIFCDPPLMRVERDKDSSIQFMKADNEWDGSPNPWEDYITSDS